MAKEMLTTKDLAEYLNINEKQVYKLIKNKKIPGTIITGKWLFPKSVIDEWIMKSARENCRAANQDSPDNQVVIAGSNDLALELLCNNASLEFPSCIYSVSNLGSLAGLTALQESKCNIAASHLLDSQTGEYNIPFIKKYLPGMKVIVLNLTHREQGLIVRKGNPQKIKTLNDLTNKKLTLINRQEGSGTRVLLDYLLKKNGINSSKIAGYSKIAYTHMEVALEVFSRSADAGIGILAAALPLGLEFIPLATERFDLIIPAGTYSSAAIKSLCGVLSSKEFKSHVVRMGGYDTKDTGKIIFEKGSGL
jgi:putative molybdopterin biosynthesis protein